MNPGETNFVIGTAAVVVLGWIGKAFFDAALKATGLDQMIANATSAVVRFVRQWFWIIFAATAASIMGSGITALMILGTIKRF